MPIPPITPRVILASSSVYRRNLLARLRIPFDVEVPAIDESPFAGEAPEQTALRLAVEKAGVVAHRFPASLIIGSDQVATMDGTQIGKPGDHERALRQLQSMRGREVIFHTALCLWDGRRPKEEAVQKTSVRTVVRFRELPDSELDAYLRLEQPYDCAGSAKNEGLGIALLEKIESEDPTALTGLPLIALTSMLRRVGIPFFAY